MKQRELTPDLKVALFVCFHQDRCTGGGSADQRYVVESIINDQFPMFVHQGLLHYPSWGAPMQIYGNFG